jgi:hypothetical protein
MLAKDGALAVALALAVERALGGPNGSTSTKS